MFGMFGIELLARGEDDLHSVLRSSAIVYICCVSSENLFECRSLCVDVQKINYRQRIRPIWRIETMMQEQSQIKTTAYTTRKTVNRLCTQTATFESCGARTNKGVTDLNIEFERQKRDQTDARKSRVSLKRIAFS